MNLYPDDPADDEPGDALAAPRCLLVLRHLLETDGPITLEELSRKVAASEVGRAPEAIGNDAVTRVRDSLRWTHVPPLVDQGVVVYDAEGDVIRATDRLKASRDVPKESRSDRRRRFLWYAIPAAMLAGSLLALEFGVVRDGDSAPLWITLAGVTTLLLVASARYLKARARRPAERPATP